jgi:hypothetical protein
MLNKNEVPSKVDEVIGQEILEILQAVLTGHLNPVETTVASYSIGLHCGLLLAKTNPLVAEATLNELQGRAHDEGRKEAADAVKRYTDSIRPVAVGPVN